MTIDQLMYSIGDIDDSYLQESIAGIPKKPRIHWGLISAAACFCLVVGSMLFLLDSVPFLHTLDVPSDSIHGNWQYVFDQRGALSERGYYYVANGNFLRYVDLTTGEGRILCHDSSCPHNSSDCGAYVRTTDRNMFYNGGYLYYFHAGDGSLRRRNADGTGDTLILERERNGMEESFAASDNYLYYTGWSIRPGSEDPYSRKAYYVSRVHLTNGRSEVLWQHDMPDSTSWQSVTLLAVQDGGVLFQWSEGIQAAPGSDEAAEQTAAMQVYVTCWDSVSEQSTDLLQKPRSELLEIPLVDNGLLYCSGTGDSAGKIRPDTMAYDLNTGEQTVAWQQAYVRSLGGGYVIVYRDEGRQILHLDSGRTVSCEGDYLQPFARAVSENGIVMCKVIREEGSSNVREQIFCYISYDVMDDGIQDTDLVELYSIVSG